MSRTIRLIVCGLWAVGLAAGVQAQTVEEALGILRVTDAAVQTDGRTEQMTGDAADSVRHPFGLPDEKEGYDFDKPGVVASVDVVDEGVSQGRFLPMHRRIDRHINRGRFAYKGELIAGLTASYGTLSSDDTEFLVILEHLDLDGTLATVKPFLGYFYRDNRCVGLRFGYEHLDGHLGNADFNLDEANDLTFNLKGVALANESYSFALFHRSYVGLDPRGRFGLFAELEASAVLGSGHFTANADDPAKATFSDNLRLKLAFNPGLAVYIFPNVSATVSLGLGGIQYNKITQRDVAGQQIGSRVSSKMRFRLNIADINFGMVVHFWDKKRP